MGIAARAEMEGSAGSAWRGRVHGEQEDGVESISDLRDGGSFYPLARVRFVQL